MISSARTANFDTHSYLKLKRKFIFFKVRGHISIHLSKDNFLYCVSIIQVASLKLSPANLVQIVVLNRTQPINIRGHMSRAYKDTCSFTL